MVRLASAPASPGERRALLLGRRTCVPRATLAFDLGVSEPALRRALKRWCAGAASPAARDALPQAGFLAAKGRDAVAPIDRLAVGRAMEHFIAGRIAACEEAALAGADAEPERTARTVSHYARALGLVRAYLADIEKDRDAEDRKPARSLSDLRDELRRHLERLWDESRNAGGNRGA